MGNYLAEISNGERCLNIPVHTTLKNHKLSDKMFPSSECVLSSSRHRKWRCVVAAGREEKLEVGPDVSSPQINLGMAVYHGKSRRDVR